MLARQISADQSAQVKAQLATHATFRSFRLNFSTETVRQARRDVDIDKKTATSALSHKGLVVRCCTRTPSMWCLCPSSSTSTITGDTGDPAQIVHRYGITLN